MLTQASLLLEGRLILQTQTRYRLMPCLFLHHDIFTPFCFWCCCLLLPPHVFFSSLFFPFSFTLLIWQCPLLAPLVRGHPQMVWKCVCVCACVRACVCCVCVCACVCVCVCGQNELEVCTTLPYPHSSFCTMPVLYTSTHTHTRILKPFKDSEPAGLKVDIATDFHAVWLLI